MDNPGTAVVVVTAADLSEICDVAADNSAAEGPTLFVAITDTLMYLPTSASVNSYEFDVAEEMFEYEPPDVDARFHWYSYDVGEPVHEPFVVVNVDPLRVVPETTGATEFVGASGV